MPKIKIEGKHKLTGQITISGAKNSAVALIPAAILCDEIVSISNIPNIADVESLEEILSYLGAQVKTTNGTITINPKEINNKEIPESISTKLRASYYFMSALLGKYKKVEMKMPGGCYLGPRTRGKSSRKKQQIHHHGLKINRSKNLFRYAKRRSHD